MATTKVRGTTIAIGTTASDPAGDTYTTIARAKMLNNNIGPEWSSIDTTVLTDVYRQEEKGVADAGDLEIGGNYDHADAGQAALQAAAVDEETDIYNFKVTQPNGRLVYVKARVFSFRISFGTNANLKEFRARLSLTDAWTEVAAA